MNNEQERWNFLPQCALVHVFQYLSLNDRFYASLTCKHWNQCFTNSKLWRNCTFKCNKLQSNSTNMIGFVKRFGKYVTNLKIIFDLLSEASEISLVLDQFAALEERQLCSLYLRKNREIEPFNQSWSICSVLKNMSYIHRVSSSLKRLFSKKTRETYQGFINVDLNNTNIMIDSDCINSLIENNPNLQVLKVQTSTIYLHQIFSENLRISSFLKTVLLCQHLTELHTFYHFINKQIIDTLTIKGQTQFKFMSLICNGPLHKMEQLETIDSDTWKRFVEKNIHVKIQMKLYDFRIEDGNVVKSILCSTLPLVCLSISHLNSNLIRYLYECFGFSLTCLLVQQLHNIGGDNADRALLQLLHKCGNLKELHCGSKLDKSVKENMIATKQLHRHTLMNYDEPTRPLRVWVDACVFERVAENCLRWSLVNF